MDGVPSRLALRPLRDGIISPTAPGARRGCRCADGVIRLTIHEGRNRSGRMCGRLGPPVKRLVLTRIGPAPHDAEAGSGVALLRYEVQALPSAGAEPGQYLAACAVLSVPSGTTTSRGHPRAMTSGCSSS